MKYNFTRGIINLHDGSNHKKNLKSKKINVASRLYFIILFHIIAFKFFTHFNNSQSLHKFFPNYTIFHLSYSFKNSILITNSNIILFLFIQSTLFKIYFLHDSFQIVPFSNHKASIQFHAYLNSLIHYIRILHTIPYSDSLISYIRILHNNSFQIIFFTRSRILNLHIAILFPVYSTSFVSKSILLFPNYPILHSIHRILSTSKNSSVQSQEKFQIINTIPRLFSYSISSIQSYILLTVQIATQLHASKFQIHFHQYLILKNLSFQIVYTISFSTPIFSTPKNPESPPSSWKNNSRRDGWFH